MRVRRIAWMVGMVVGCVLLIAWATKRQQVALQTCPFDSNLSLGVAFQGPHLHFDTHAVQDKVMNARIAWFSTTEHPDPDVFEYRVAQEPPEEDWDWWTTLYPTTLIVQVTDAQNRLGKAEVWKYEGNILKGILPATPDGSTIVGSLKLEAPTPFWRLSIKDKQGETLAETLLKNPETKLIVSVIYADWVPHPPKRDFVVELDKEEPHFSIFEDRMGKHPVQRYDFEKRQTVTEYVDCTVRYWRAREGCPPHTGFNEQHRTSVGTFGPPPEGCSILDIRGEKICETWVDVFVGGSLPISAEEILCMTKHFVNDNPNPASVTPPQYYRKRYVRRKIDEFPGREYIVEADRPVIDELRELQAAKSDDATVITPSIQVPPYSKGCLHWDISAVTDIRALYVAPARKVEKQRDWFLEFIASALRVVTAGIMGSAHEKKNKLVEALVDAWVKDVSQRKEVKEAGFQVGDLKFYGDIWVLHLSLGSAGPMYPPPLQNITQDIRVQIVVVKPDGTKEPVYGSLSVERLEAWTKPEPPMHPLPPSSIDIPPEGREIGLGKGWKWKLTAFAVGRSAEKVISVPLDPPQLVIEVPAPQPPPGG